MYLYADTKAMFPPKGNTGIHYVDKSTAITYRFNNDRYEIDPSVPQDPAIFVPPVITTLTLFDTYDQTSTTESGVKGWSASAPANPSHTGVTFTGWFDAITGGNSVAFPLSVFKDMTVYAQFESAGSGS